MKESLTLGETVRHPDGRDIKIVGCKCHDGKTVCWMWREILGDGKLGKREEGKLWGSWSH